MQYVSLDTRRSWTLEEEHEWRVQELITNLREEPECAAWEEERLRGLAEGIWEMEYAADAEQFHREKDAGSASLSPQIADPHPSPLPKGEGVKRIPAARLDELRQQRDKRRTREERRREFLAPLAAG